MFWNLKVQWWNYCACMIVRCGHFRIQKSILSLKGDFRLGGTCMAVLGFAIAVPIAAAHPSRPRLMASWREERDYGALPSEQRSEPRVTVADSPTQPTGFNHVCSPSMFSLFLIRFISLRLCFSLPSSILLSLSLCTGVLETFFLLSLTGETDEKQISDLIWAPL